MKTWKEYLNESKFQYYKFHDEGDLHRNPLLQTLEVEYGINFKNYDLSTTGIRPKNKKTDDILKKLFAKK